MDPYRNAQPNQESIPLEELHPQSSKLIFFSLGIAANNKVVGSNKLYVFPHEALPLRDGELISQPFDQVANGWDASDQMYQTKVITDTSLECDWFPVHQGNRRTSPDIRRGERIEIWRYADRDEYLWCEIGADSHLRKLETVVWGVSGTPDEKIDGTQPENSYFCEVSTHKKSITISTSKKNGEYTTYAIQIDAGGGKITISDALGNNIHFNSKETLIEMENADGTVIQCNRQDIIMKAPQNVNVKAENNIDIKAGNAIRVEAGANLVLKAGGKVLVDGQAEFLDPVKMNAPLTATGITSSAPITGPSDTI
jgi:hypothetical protein